MLVAVAVLAVAAPQFVVDERVGDPSTIATIAAEHWAVMAELVARVTGGTASGSAATDGAATDVPATPVTTVHIFPGRNLRPGVAGTSRYGRVELRSTGAVTPELTTALRHELGHQFLWATCPAATEDRLFHEAFALIVSGELARWNETYVTTPQAARTLAEASSLDTPQSRIALARLIRESLTDTTEIPRLMVLRLATCGGNTPWRPLAVAELAPAERVYSDAFVVLNRHSGELVAFEGAVDTAMPFASVLKPFLVAAAPDAPTLAPARGDVNWECGDALPSKLTAAQALARSCNGYFLAWGRASPAASRFGAYGAMLIALGLPRLPNAMSEAIGITPTLTLTPRAVAEAYRALALTSPTTLTALADTARFGTLAGLGLDGSPKTVGSQLRRSFKTGTVRDPQSRPLVGWLVQVTQDHVAVTTVAGKQPRDFAVHASQRLSAIERRAQERRVDVQVFGLVGTSQVTLQCNGVALRGGEVLANTNPNPNPNLNVNALPSANPRPSSSPDLSVNPSANQQTQIQPQTQRRMQMRAQTQMRNPVQLSSVLADGDLLCLGAPWLVHVGGGSSGSSTVAGAARRVVSDDTRTYAGTFAFAELPAGKATDDTTASRRALRARRGSEVIFTTSLGAYVAGVVHQEGGTITGAPREALVRIIAHNVYEPRHVGRPICDTTHCQVFKGTMHLGDEDARSVARALPYRGWLPFALGGDEPWEKTVPAHEITRVLGANAANLHLGSDYVTFIRTSDETSDEQVRVRCEVLRNALHLLSCPTSVTPSPTGWTFKGQGAGHSQGLNLLQAQSTNQSADSLLQSAYGPAPSP